MWRLDTSVLEPSQLPRKVRAGRAVWKIHVDSEFISDFRLRQSLIPFIRFFKDTIRKGKGWRAAFNSSLELVDEVGAGVDDEMKLWIKNGVRYAFAAACKDMLICCGDRMRIAQVHNFETHEDYYQMECSKQCGTFLNVRKPFDLNVAARGEETPCHA